MTVRRGLVFRGAALAGALILVGAPAPDARAGDAYWTQIVAATPDGAHCAFFIIENGNLSECGLAKVESKTPACTNLIAKASCTEPDGKLLPLDKWTWPRKMPEVAALRPFDKDSDGKVARIGMDVDTYMTRLELRRGDGWVVARPLESDGASLTGVLAGTARTLLRVSHSEQLNDWDDLWSVSDAELAGAPALRAATRQEAREATARMREHRAKGTGVFAPTPAGSAREKWAQRRRHGIGTFINKWEVTAVYGPLDAADLRDALWLLAWFDSPRRRYEAMRWFGGLRERDAAGAAALLADLEKDADARALAAFLKTTRDHFRSLPQIREATDASLRGLSDDQLQWLHRRAWAENGYHFRDAGVTAYLTLIPGAAPMPERRWKKMTADPAFLKDPDAPLVGPAAPQSGTKTGLEAILRAERARALAKPAL